MQARLAQLVYTVTRVPDVHSVVPHLQGRPVEVFSGEGLFLEGPPTREGYVHFLPTILVDSPAWFEPVVSPVPVSGVANVFEATFRLLVTDDEGASLREEVITASCGTGCWGDFSVDVAYELDRDQFGAVKVWNESPPGTAARTTWLGIRSACADRLGCPGPGVILARCPSSPPWWGPSPSPFRPCGSHSLKWRR